MKMFFGNPQEIPLEQMKESQWKRLKKQIKYCYDKSPLYYRKKMDEFGIKPEDIKTWEDFRNIPILCNKEEERKAQEESMEKLGHPYGTYLCAPLEKVIYISSTGGTTGFPTFMDINTENDMKSMWAPSMFRIFEWMGLKPGDTVANIFAQCMHAWGFLFNYSAVTWGLRVIPLGAEAGSERILRTLDMVKPTSLWGTPPLVEHLIERAPGTINKDVRDLGIKILALGGAPGAGIPSIRKKLEEAYGAKIYDVQPMWISRDKPEEYGMHYINFDFWIIGEDLIDPETSKPLEITDGVIGHGLLTNICEAKPMLKYGFGDLIQVFTKECPCCGFKGLRAKIVGRADEMLIIKGVNVFPTAIKGIVNEFLPRVTGEMRIVLDKPGPAVDPPMKIKVEHAKGLTEDQLSQLKKELEGAFHSKLEFRADVEMVSPETFERAGGFSAKGTLVEKAYKSVQKK
jgi:phenylacetate-CoA ligase